MRRIHHGKPLAGASLALALTSFPAGALTVIALRDGDSVLPALAVEVLGVVLALLLQWGDAGLLRLAGISRPERYRELWRRAWMLVPPLAALAGALCASLSGAG